MTCFFLYCFSLLHLETSFIGSFMAASGFSKMSRLRQGERQKEAVLEITAVSRGRSALQWSIDLHCCIRQMDFSTSDKT